MERNPVVGGRCQQCGLYHADKVGPCPNRPSRSPEQVLINPPKISGTVEDSHASLAAEMRAVSAGYIMHYTWAARVEALGRIEEKKAAFLEAALEWGKWYCDNFKGYFKSGDWSAEEKKMMVAYRALVESERIGESASKKEDAGT